MTDAEEMAAYARRQWGAAGTDEEIGRALVARHTAGPRLWAGLRILKSLGLMTNGSEAAN